MARLQAWITLGARIIVGTAYLAPLVATALAIITVFSSNMNTTGILGWPVGPQHHAWRWLPPLLCFMAIASLIIRDRVDGAIYISEAVYGLLYALVHGLVMVFEQNETGLAYIALLVASSIYFLYLGVDRQNELSS